MNTLRPGIQAIVDSRVDEILADGATSADLVAQFALPIPSIVICELLGVPYEDHEFFEEQSLRRFDPVQGDAMIKLYDYLDELILRKTANPGDGRPGLLDELLANQVKEGLLDHAGLVMFALELLIGGHDTTANMIALGVLTLLEHPEQLAAVRGSDKALSGAVEELLRSLAIVNSLSRVATEDIEIAGRTIRAGDGILVSPPAVNHDAQVMEHPEEFRVDRTDRRHIGFGYGNHQCLGQNLARLEMEVAYRTLFKRVPELRLAIPLDEVKPREGMLAGVLSLPVAW
ncbi:cytochrome P450 [Streptomyces sp. NPDC057307]|uniref:cytochrome P450 n=1 Tax=Streptomyces sp. NPDC057307 TaxID=3346096 RepID=UPI003631D43C